MYSEGYGDKTQIGSKPSEKTEMRNLMCTRQSFTGEDIALSATEALPSP